MSSRSRKSLSSSSPAASKTPKKAEKVVHQTQEDECIIREALEKASNKYPGFISSDAFQGSVVEAESERSGSSGATLWMSEAAMFAHSFFPGTCVAVSLAVSARNFSSDMFPLESLADLCSKHYDIELEDSAMDEIGTCFACAIVWPSRKLFLNGVKLFKHLSFTMGSPALGRTVYISPLHINSTSQRIKRILKLPSPKNDQMCQILLSECIDLSLKWLIPKSSLGSSYEVSSVDQARSSNCENERFSSPRTPLGYRSKIMPTTNMTRSRSPLVQSPVLNDSPQHKNSELTLFCKDNVDRTPSPCSPNLAAIKAVMEDGKLKELLQRYAVRWLSDRILLRGNFVMIPVCGQMCFFQLKDGMLSSETCGLEQTSDYASSCNLSNTLVDAEEMM